MNRQKLARLVALLGTVVLGGISYTLYVPKPDATRADFVDAGIANAVKHRIKCEVRNVCTGQYRTVELRAFRDGQDVLVELPRVEGRDCWQLTGTPREACRVVEASSCTDATICGDGTPAMREVSGECACSSGADCYVGGEAAPTGQTLQAGTWSGAGCVPKVCRVLNGDQGQDWPGECPLP